MTCGKNNEYIVCSLRHVKRVDNCERRVPMARHVAMRPAVNDVRCHFLMNAGRWACAE